MVRDLLKELNQNNAVTCRTPDRKQKPSLTFRTAQTIEAQTKKLQQAASRVKVLGRSLAQETRSRVVAEKKAEYRELLGCAGKASKIVRASFQRYARRLTDGGFVDQIEKNQVQLAQYRFFKELEQFTKLSTKFERRQESRVKRVLRCMEVHKTDDEIAELAANEQEFQTLLRQEMGTPLCDQVLGRLVCLEGYHKTLDGLAAQTQEIRNQWEMMNSIINHHQEQVDRIVDNIEVAHESCSEGVQRLETASWYQKITQNLQFLGFAGAGAVALSTAI